MRPWVQPSRLAWFHGAGALTPLEALQTATINPVKFVGLTKPVGTGEKGKIADLVLLDANPLENVANNKRHAEYLPLSRPGWVFIQYPARSNCGRLSSRT
jgi:imidazolonepropionase-like amidohydrolase